MFLLVLVDVNECFPDQISAKYKHLAHNCHVDANCSNTNGSFYCMCHTGYSGDGVTCIGTRDFQWSFMLFRIFLYEITRTRTRYYHAYFSSQTTDFSVDIRNAWKKGVMRFMGCIVFFTSNSGHSYVLFSQKISTSVTHLGYHLSINTWLIFAMMMPTVPTQKDLTTAHAWTDTLEMESPAKVNHTLSLQHPS